MPYIRSKIIAALGIQLPALPSQATLGTNSSGDIIAGSGAGVVATPTLIAGGNTVTVDSSTQMLWRNGVTVSGALAPNGSFQGI